MVALWPLSPEDRKNDQGIGTRFPLLLVLPGVVAVGLVPGVVAALAPVLSLLETTAKSILPDIGLIKTSSIFPMDWPVVDFTSAFTIFEARRDCPIMRPVAPSAPLASRY